MKAGWRRLLEHVKGIPFSDPEQLPRSLRAALMSGVTALLAAVILWAIYTDGVSRGMDHVLAYGIEMDTAPMSIALSESFYGVDGGYVGLRSVYYALQLRLRRGSTPSDDSALVRNLRDREAINEAIHDAITVIPDKLGYGTIADGTVITTMYNDIGAVDYMKLAFRLFGPRVEALYLTFFVMLGLSALLFLVTFPNSLSAQLVLLGVLLAFLLELQTPVFSNGMPTFASVRHGSTLALIPAWYFALLFLHRRRFSWLLILLTAGQLAILILAITVRSTATWTVVFLTGLALVGGTYRYRLAPPVERTPALWRRSVVSWPVVVLVAALIIQGQYTKLKLHPVYSTDDITPYHPIWHAAYVGFLYSPELYGIPMPPEMAGADAFAYVGALHYLQSIHFIGNENNLTTREALLAGGYYSQWNGGNPKYRLHDRIMRLLVFHIVKEHPLTVMYMLAVKKPYATWTVMRSLVSRSEPAFKRLTLAGVIIGGVLLFVFGRRREWLELVRVVPVGMGAIFAALLACLWAYPNSWSVTDGLLLGFGMVVVVLAMVPYFILSGGALALEFVFPRAGLDRWRSDDGTASIAAAVGAGWVFPLMVPLLVSVLAYSGVVLGRYALTEAKPSSRADADGRVVPPANGKKWSPDRTRASDFDGDTMSDITLFRPSTGEWWTMRSSTAFDPVASPLSAGTGIVAPGDYDGDGWADVAVFQPGDGSWRVRLSHDSYQSMQTIAGGRNGDIPVPGDYDGDNTTDFAFFRPADSTWHILRSSEGRTKWWEVKFGLGSDVPVPDDYDGDHKTDAAVFRPSTGTWLVLTSSTGFTESVEHRFGTSADIPVPGDYDGDGKADPAVYNAVSGDWQILKSTTNYAAATTFRSQPASIPVPGDYDGDGLTDIAVFQPPIFTWFILKSSTGNSDSLTRAWGVATDIPIFK